MWGVRWFDLGGVKSLDGVRGANGVHSRLALRARNTVTTVVHVHAASVFKASSPGKGLKSGLDCSATQANSLFCKGRLNTVQG